VKQLTWNAGGKQTNGVKKKEALPASQGRSFDEQ
jgi:hypothetical protein